MRISLREGGGKARKSKSKGEENYLVIRSSLAKKYRGIFSPTTRSVAILHRPNMIRSPTAFAVYSETAAISDDFNSRETHFSN